MKLPFISFLGPSLKRHSRGLDKFCNHPFFAFCDLYVVLVGLFGAAFSAFDVIMILKCGPTLPKYLMRSRGDYGKIVAPTTERDLKLIALLVAFKCYFLLEFGIGTTVPVFFLPYLILYGLMICVEIFTTFLRLFADGFTFNKSALFTSIFILFNWLNVFCCFWKKLSYCDLH